MASQNPTQSSNLQPGRLPQLYGVLPPKNDTTPNGPNHVSFPSPPRPPGLSGSRPVDGSGTLQRQTPKTIGRGLVFCLAVVLLETILMISRTDPLAALIDNESASRRASMANSTLAVEKEKVEHERDAMRRERELWEKAREDRVPQGAFWEVVWPAWDCRAYGKREYWGMLQNIPEGWSDMDACMNMPVEIKGVTVRRPYRCAYTLESPHIHGYWMVDWDQPDCKPWYHDYQDAGCTSYKSGKRRIEAQIVGINNRREQDWQLLCYSTPLVWDLISYASPTHCEERRGGRKVAMWEVPDVGCLDLGPLTL